MYIYNVNINRNDSSRYHNRFNSRLQSIKQLTSQSELDDEVCFYRLYILLCY